MFFINVDQQKKRKNVFFYSTAIVHTILFLNQNMKSSAITTDKMYIKLKNINNTKLTL